MTAEESFPELHDVLIIGAGPCGLAVAARLRERTASAIFTDVEHERYHWIRNHGRQTTIKSVHGRSKIQCEKCPASRSIFKTLVIDAAAPMWMARWEQLFDIFAISHLRSPMFFHPDPRDRDGLLAFTYEQHREDELLEIRGCVGKEISKHKKKKKRIQSRYQSAGLGPSIDERDRKDYFTPSRSIFADYCKQIVAHYGLDTDQIKCQKVEDIDFRYYPELAQDVNIFIVKTDKGYHYARTVVLAVGPGNAPTIPHFGSITPIPGACHSMHIKSFPDPRVAAKIAAGRPTNIAVVGGGLTSAQISDLAVKKGVTKVWHLMRGPCKVKPFDVDLAWMGKFSNTQKAAFWSADEDEERLDQIRDARGGGSITARFQDVLNGHIAKGRLSLHTHTCLLAERYDPSSETWHIETVPAIPDLPAMDYIYFATGIQTDFTTIPALQTMNAKFKVKDCGGLPCINDDLMWRDDVPLFVTGRLAALRLGPGAGNLEGARLGAERITWAIEDLLGTQEARGNTDDGSVSRYYYEAGIGSRYNVIVEDE